MKFPFQSPSISRIHRASLGLSSLPSLLCGAVQGLQFEATFESGELEFSGGDGAFYDFRSSGNDTANVTSAVVRSGSHAARMSLTRATDAVKNRTEIVAGNQYGNLRWGEEYWMGYSFYLKDWTVDQLGELVFQIHGVPSDWNNCSAGRDPWCIYTENGKIGLAVVDSLHAEPTGSATGTRVWEEDYVPNQWYDWVVNVKLLPNDDGFIRVWCNGELIYEHQGVTTNDIDTCQEPLDSRGYLKLGIYKWNWINEPSDVPSREIYYDEIRIGSVAEGYEGGFLGVSPGGRPMKGTGKLWENTTDDFAPWYYNRDLGSWFYQYETNSRESPGNWVYFLQ